jgi:site-specific DNA-methyltransferase (adenine-specific)
MNTEVMFSSKEEKWATPQEFFDMLNKEFSFNLDPCATPENAKCKKYFTEAEDGLKQDWGGYCVFCNPPYGRKTGAWVEKAYNESKKPGTTVVCLLPSRTDTKWFHEFIVGNGEIRFIKGRLKFGDSKNSAPFGSMLVIWGERAQEGAVRSERRTR